MKLLPTTPRVRPDDTLGHGMEAALTILLFLGIGYGLDRWLGTMPLLTIVLVLFAAVGTFVKLKYSYEARMRVLEDERRAASRGASA
jgi:ATP synthase protein I